MKSTKLSQNGKEEQKKLKNTKISQNLKTPHELNST
jgi:hypothetical protein